MKEKKYIIIGGGAAGTTAAETIRNHDKSAIIAIISDEPYHYYSRIMLSKPNFFLEKIPFKSIWLKDEAWYKKNAISFIGGKKVVAIDIHKKIITLDNADIVSYDKLLLATGGFARTLNISGFDKKNIFYLRTLDDAQSIIAEIKHSKKTVVIGGGFVGFEMCDMLHLAGMEVTAVVRESYFWENVLDKESGKIIENAFTESKIRIIHNVTVNEITGEDKVEGIVLSDGTKIDADIIIVGIGTIFPIEWIKKAGIKTASGVIVNEFLETNIPDIWSAGDVAEFKDVILNEQIQMGNWVNAQQQGKIAGLNMLASSGVGLRTPFRLVSFYTAYGFNIAIAFVGDVRDKGVVFITRRFPKSNACVRLILKDDIIKGATLINQTKELSVITKLIEKGISLKGKEKDLSDPNFVLQSLI